MKTRFLLLFVAGFLCLSGFSQKQYSFDVYHTPEEIQTFLQATQKANQKNTKLHLIGKSWSGMPVHVLEIGSETKSDQKNNPAILVAANFEGVNPLASEAAVYLIKDLLKKPDQFKNLTWYILSSGNPEAHASFFNSPNVLNMRNMRPVNDDLDDQIDEDPTEDLNGDGFITQMRVKDPAGSYIIDSVDSRLLAYANSSKGERGIYKIYSEGIDNDEDGSYNEDGQGGTNNGVSFPHLFDGKKSDTGRWPGQEDEVFGVFKFVTDHPEIALTMHYGQSNFCLVPPKSGRKGTTNMNSLRVPRRYAGMLNADPSKTYTMAEVKVLVKAVVPPGTPVDDSMVAGMLGLGAAVNPQAKDLKLYKEFSKKYKAFLKENEISIKRLDPTPAKDGSFELWTYYHIGLPSFSQDFWGVPILLSEGKDSTKQGAKLATKMPAKMPAKKPAKKQNKTKSFMTYSDSLLGGKGFVAWEKYEHPQLGEIEIGGQVPLLDRVPPADQIEALLKGQVPWVYELSKAIPDLRIEDKRVTSYGEGVYRVEAWIRNEGKFHFPTAMGSRNGNPPPAIISLTGDGLEILEGKVRTPIKGIDAGAKRKLTWLVRVKKGTDMKLLVKAVNAIGSESIIKAGGAK